MEKRFSLSRIQGKDNQYIFFGENRLPKVNIDSWAKLLGYYSKDDKSVYFGNKVLKEADPITFKAYIADGGYYVAQDKDKFYRNQETITEEEFMNCFDY